MENIPKCATETKNENKRSYRGPIDQELITVRKENWYVLNT